MECVYIFLRRAVRSAQTRFVIYNYAARAAEQTSSNKSRVYCANTRNSWSPVYLSVLVCVCVCEREIVCAVLRAFFPSHFSKSVRAGLRRGRTMAGDDDDTGDAARAEAISLCINNTTCYNSGGGHCGLDNDVILLYVRRVK